MKAVRELGPDETALAFDVIVELRPDISSRDEFVHQVNDLQRPEGYRMIGSFESNMPTPVAVAGFRTGHSLAWGHYLYVDDLVTASAARKHGHATAIIHWLLDEAARIGCDQLHLVRERSGTARTGSI